MLYQHLHTTGVSIEHTHTHAHRQRDSQGDAEPNGKQKFLRKGKEAKHDKDGNNCCSKDKAVMMLTKQTMITIMVTMRWDIHSQKSFHRSKAEQEQDGRTQMINNAWATRSNRDTSTQSGQQSQK